MANLHFTTILLLCHTLLRLTGQTTSSSFSSNITMSTTSISAISMNTSSKASKGQSTSSILPSSTTVSLTAIRISSTNTSPAGEGQSTSSILPSNATNPVQPVAPQTSTSTPSSTTLPAAEGFDITYNIKEGECERVCCDGGAGGPVKMIPTCNPPSNHSSCSKEKEEGDRCPGAARDVCSSTCGSRSAHCASFVLVGLLAIAAFFK
ncbi:uncharacterized protein [Acropora muricata]|uniref:uncharacterized protein isoform X2 n=1 Tax=Acropora muricata TaxID=159855 RepID=UPI0034E59549